MEREDDVVRHVGHAAAPVRALADGAAELGAVAHVGGGGAIVGAFVVDHDLFFFARSNGQPGLFCAQKNLFFVEKAMHVLCIEGGREVVRTFSVTAASSVCRPPVAKALSQRWAMPCTSSSCMQVPHGLPSLEGGEE